MSYPKISSYEKIVGKACVVEILGLGYFRVICENGRGDLISSQTEQHVSVGEIGWVVEHPGFFLGALRFVRDTSLSFDFERAKNSYLYDWKNTWPWPVPDCEADDNFKI